MYDQRALLAKLEPLDRGAKTAFASACAQRLLPLLERYARVAGVPAHAQRLAGILAAAWDVSSGRVIDVRSMDSEVEWMARRITRGNGSGSPGTGRMQQLLWHMRSGLGSGMTPGRRLGRPSKRMRWPNTPVLRHMQTRIRTSMSRTLWSWGPRLRRQLCWPWRRTSLPLRRLHLRGMNSARELRPKGDLEPRLFPDAQRQCARPEAGSKMRQFDRALGAGVDRFVPHTEICDTTVIWADGQVEERPPGLRVCRASAAGSRRCRRGEWRNVARSRRRVRRRRIRVPG
jgi:hypothetical protein